MLSSAENDGGKSFNFNRLSKFNSFVSNCEFLDVKAMGCITHGAMIMMLMISFRKD